MLKTETRMRREILEIPAAVDRLLREGAGPILSAARDVADFDPALAVTVARGSSDHVCTYLKYASELHMGLPVASIGPSIASIYQATLRLPRAVCIAVSQSGKSPDIVEMTRSAGQSGARTVALTNVVGAPLGQISDHVVDICAGAETSVAATKTFVNSAVAGLLLLAEWSGDKDLLRAIHRLPNALERAVAIDWPELREALAGTESLFTLGRGPAWAISNEAALKFKETCRIHAESYSSAEVLHGPVAIVGDGFPVLCFAAADAAQEAVVGIADNIAAKGGRAFVTSGLARRAEAIDHVRTDHALTDPISLIASFYAMVEQVAAARGIDPDTPRHLKKVTETL